jgi:hypothetical protein
MEANYQLYAPVTSPMEQKSLIAVRYNGGPRTSLDALEELEI